VTTLNTCMIALSKLADCSSQERQQRVLQAFFWCSLCVLPLVMGLLSFQFAISWDEPDHQDYGRLVLDYYLSGLKDKGALTYKLNYLNGGFFDFFCTLFQMAVSSLEPYDARHLFNSFIGALSIGFAALFARRLFGPLAGLLTIIFLALSPRFTSDCMNNPKDLPFAGMFVLSLYALSFAKARFPFFTPRIAGFAILSMGLLLNIRVGGLLMLCYAGLYLGVLALRDPEARTWRRLTALVAGYAVACVAVLLLGSLFWPWAQQNPLAMPFEALQQVSKYPWAGTLLFGGELYDGKNLPWNYIPSLYWLSAPLAVLVGVVLSLPFLGRLPQDRLILLALLFSTVFPVAYAIGKNVLLYNGLRHLLFIYPPFVVLAAGGWSRLLCWPGLRRVGFACALAVLALSLWHPLWFSLRYLPYQSIYYNELVGGVRGANGKYELDYWGCSYKEAVDWIRRQPRAPGAVVRVFAPYGTGGGMVEAYAARFPDLLFTTDQDNSDYHVFLNWLIFQDVVEYLQRDVPRTHVVEVEGAPLCFVVRQ